ncbi:Uncharacterised protein [Raoultella ornithinolytica]|nr:Uncharacterised protein [Raoultella ornithinolytica]
MIANYNEVDAGSAAPGTTRLQRSVLRVVITPIKIVVIFRFWRWWWVFRYVRHFHFSFNDIRLDGRYCENSVIASKNTIIRKEVDQTKPLQELANTDVIPQAGSCYSPVDKAIVVEGYWISHGTPGVFRLLLKPLADLVIVIRSFAFPRVPMFHAFPFFMIICAWVKYEHN